MTFQKEVAMLDKLLNFRDEVAAAMDKLRRRATELGEANRITVVCRSEDGTRDFVLTNDDLLEACRAAVRHHKRTEEVGSDERIQVQ